MTCTPAVHPSDSKPQVAFQPEKWLGLKIQTKIIEKSKKRLPRNPKKTHRKIRKVHPSDSKLQVAFQLEKWLAPSATFLESHSLVSSRWLQRWQNKNQTIEATKVKVDRYLSILGFGPLVAWYVGGSRRRWEDKLLRVPSDDGRKPAHHQLKHTSKATTWQRLLFSQEKLAGKMCK